MNSAALRFFASLSIDISAPENRSWSKIPHRGKLSPPGNPARKQQGRLFYEELI